MSTTTEPACWSAADVQALRLILAAYRQGWRDAIAHLAMQGRRVDRDFRDLYACLQVPSGWAIAKSGGRCGRCGLTVAAGVPIRPPAAGERGWVGQCCSGDERGSNDDEYFEGARDADRIR